MVNDPDDTPFIRILNEKFSPETFDKNDYSSSLLMDSIVPPDIIEADSPPSEPPPNMACTETYEAWQNDISTSFFLNLLAQYDTSLNPSHTYNIHNYASCVMVEPTDQSQTTIPCYIHHGK